MGDNKALQVVVVGTGMYACGRGQEGYGTVMPAVFEWKRCNALGDISIVGTNPDSIAAAKKKIEKLKRNMNVKASIKYFPEEGPRDAKCYKEVIRNVPKPAACIVVVPDFLHKDIAAAAIDNGLHTLVVKPLAPTLKEVRELIALKRKKKVYCAVEFHKRLDYANMKLKDVVRAGTIGDPLYFLAEYSQRKSIPSKIFKKWVESTNAFQYLGIHYVDIIYFATGGRPIRAMALGRKGWLVSKGIDTHDSVESAIEWRMPSGKKFGSYIATNWIDPESSSAMSDQKIKVIGTKGRFESDQKDRGIKIVTDDGGAEELNPYFCSAYGPAGEVAYRGYGIDSIHQFLKDVIDIEDGVIEPGDLKDKRPTFEQSIIPIKVLEAVNRSLKNNGKWIAIDED